MIVKSGSSRSAACALCATFCGAFSLADFEIFSPAIEISSLTTELKFEISPLSAGLNFKIPSLVAGSNFKISPLAVELNLSVSPLCVARPLE